MRRTALLLGALALATPAIADDVFYAQSTTTDLLLTSALPGPVASSSATTVLSGAPLNVPQEVEFGGGKLFFSDLTNDGIYSVPAGAPYPKTYTTVYDLTTMAEDDTVFSIAVNGAGTTAYFTHSLGGALPQRQISRLTGIGGTVTFSTFVDLTAFAGDDTYSTSNLPRGIALDELNGKLFFGDGTTDYIYSVNTDGSAFGTLIDLRVAAGNVATNVSILSIATGGGKLFWSENTTDGIYFANLDGSSAGLFFSLDAVVNGSWTPQDLEYHNGRLYFTDSSQNGVFSVSASNPTVGDFQTHVTGSNLTGLAIPEPASLSVLGLGALALLRRRR